MREDLLPSCARIRALMVGLLLFTTAARPALGDMTWLYAVQLSAMVQTNPPQITLHWEPDEYGADSYAVSRKLKTDDAWGQEHLLPGTATNFTDAEVSPASAFEYQVIKHATLGYTGYGYIYAGIEAPLIEDRGTVILVVAADTRSLAPELARLRKDLVGDGWSVIEHDVSPDDNPGFVRNLIQTDYSAAPARVQTVFLLGHVPIVMSGQLDYDSHGARPMPADGFYGDMTGDWRLDLDPTNRPSYFPAEINLMVGRVDFFDMPGVGALSPWPSELELLKRYLDKEHAWRQKQITAPRRALMANRVGDANGQAYAASGYRNFEPFVGPGNIVEANVADDAPADQRWISLAAGGAWLWSYACGGGQDSIISQLGTHDIYHDVWSTDIVGQDAKVAFSMFMGSHFGDWTRPDNVMRAMLATPSLGLTACLVGLPHWFCHHMALGEPIGYAARLTMNNAGLYRSQSNALPRAVLINLLGDPTLRMEPVAPPSMLSGTAGNGGVTLHWAAPVEPVLGYLVYRAASPDGPFTRLTASPITYTTFNDSVPYPASNQTYMVRAIALMQNPSGSYLDPSEGVFVQVSTGPPQVPPIILSAAILAGELELNWNTESNVLYRVEAKSLSATDDWSYISGDILAQTPVTTFVDTNAPSFRARLYRVVRE